VSFFLKIKKAFSTHLQSEILSIPAFHKTIKSHPKLDPEVVFEYKIQLKEVDDKRHAFISPDLEKNFRK
jgi:hypothetical protein